jgi:hypothetical protein
VCVCVTEREREREREKERDAASVGEQLFPPERDYPPPALLMASVTASQVMYRSIALDCVRISRHYICIETVN